MAIACVEEEGRLVGGVGLERSCDRDPRAPTSIARSAAVVSTSRTQLGSSWSICEREEPGVTPGGGHRFGDLRDRAQRCRCHLSVRAIASCCNE